MSGLVLPRPHSPEFESEYEVLWVRNNFTPGNPFPTDERLLVSHYSAAISMDNARSRYIP